MTPDPVVLDTVGRFAREVLALAATEIDANARSTSCHVPAMAELGLMGLNLPDAEGGAGIDPVTLFEATALVAGACGSTASLLTAHWLASEAILHGGDPAQRGRWLPGLAAGELGAFALTEPGAGSNPADMTTKAMREGEGYRITGTKHFISNAGEAAVIVVFTKTDPAAGIRGLSAFVVEPRHDGGVACAAPERTMGLRGAPVFEVSFDTVVPADRRLGPEGGGFRVAARTLDAGRLEIAACCIGIAEAAFGQAREWARTRRVGGQPIASFQGLQWMLADMATDIAAARALGHAAAEVRARGERFTTEASMAKLYASEMVGRVTDAALQIHGGYGYTADLPLERYVRDARIMRIFEGTSEIQRSIVARAVLA